MKEPTYFVQKSFAGTAGKFLS